MTTELQSLANDFRAFCILQNQDFEIAEHHKIIAKKLMQIESGEIKRLIINMPPRHGKSFMCSQYFPAWYLGKNPDKYIISASYGQQLANDFGRAVKNLMGSDNFRQMFDVKIAKDSHSQKRFNTIQGGSYFAVGRGGPIVGRGGHLIIIDDLLKGVDEARSELIRSNMKQWYKNNLYTRLMPGGAIIIINTRWHIDDLSGWLIKESGEDWKVLSLPAITKDNKALWPSFYDIQTLHSIKTELGTQAFEAQYQQSPVLEGGNIIKEDWVRLEKPLPYYREYIQSWDLSFKGNKNSDYCVGQLWGKTATDIVLIDQVRGQWDFTETIKQIKRFSNKHPKATVKLIEDKANGPAVISTLKSQVLGLKPINPKSDKISRLRAVSPLFEAGNIVFDVDAYWLNELMHETITFPNGKHDDQVDAMTQAIDYLSKKTSSAFATAGESVLSENKQDEDLFPELI